MSSSHCFSHAHDFNIEQFTFVNTNSTNPHKSPFQHLCDNIAVDAAYNSAERHDAPTCHEDTRKAVQEEILNWITHGDQDAEPKKILSLMGPAGTGKTAIVGTVADTCDELGILAGSFFFASFTASEARRSKRFLVATLAYHLVSSLGGEHPLRCAILSAVQQDPLIFRKRLKDQFKLLFIKPLNDTRHLFDISTLPKVFILDGLDEVEVADSRQPGRDPQEVRLENEADQEDILGALLYAAKSSAFPFRIIVASRPERVITAFFSSSASELTRNVFLDEKYDPNSDIRLYLSAKLSEIRRRYRLPPSWPSGEEMQSLVDSASGQFIYASTVVRVLQTGRHPNPQALLTSLQSSQAGELGALAPLDALYTRVLKSTPDLTLAARWIVMVKRLNNQEYCSALFIDQYLQDYPGQAAYLLENLASLLWIPPVEDESSRYRFYHKSFLDFLKDGDRCCQDPQLARALISAQDTMNWHDGRWFDVYKRKSPVVPLPESQHDDFFRRFIQAEIALRKIETDRGSSKWDVLKECDVVWWVHRVFTLPDPAVGMSYWFQTMHHKCSMGECTPACKHWRSNIIRACQELGWSFPNAVALLRETLIPRGSCIPTTHWSPFRYFRPPSKALELTVNNLRPQATLTKYAVDEEYEETLGLVEAMRSHFPVDWRTQFRLEVRRDLYATYRGFTAVIEKVREELGVEEPDVLCYVDEAYFPAPPQSHAELPVEL